MLPFIAANTDSYSSGWVILALGIFKTALIVSGTACVYLGYRLFRLGIIGESDVEAGANEYKLTIKRAAPGTIFALFGAVLVGITAYRGLDIEYSKKSGSGEERTNIHAVMLQGQAWEFKVSSIYNVNMQESLNNLGEKLGPEGWDLVSVSEHGPEGNRQLLCVFKRIKRSETPTQN